MKICVLGTGVIGVSTAYMLGRMGHEVIVIDKGLSVATGASEANGAQLSYSYVDPFATPGALRKLPAYLRGLDPGIRLGLSLNPLFIKWGIEFLNQCRQSRFERNLKARTDLAQLSKKTLALIADELPLKTLQSSGIGKLVLAHSKAECDHMRSTAATRSDIEFVSFEECQRIEPMLTTWASPIHGGLYAKDDRALDTVEYCNALKKSAEEKYGVVFRFGEKVERIETQNGQMKSVSTSQAQRQCDAAIVCLGNEASSVLKPLGIKTTLYPMQGYSVTLPAFKSSAKTSVTDLSNKIVYANLGSKIRIAGFLDANQSAAKAKTRGQELLRIARQQWPDIADYDNPLQTWTHYRPMVPSGVPTIGPTKIDGVYLNVGHGSLGYTFAAGSASIIAKSIETTHTKTQCEQGMETLWT